VILGWEGRWFLASSAVVALYLLFQSSFIGASTLVSSDRSSHALTRNIGSTQQSTCTMSCLISRLVEQ
jgi:hypothetical protein